MPHLLKSIHFIVKIRNLLFAAATLLLGSCSTEEPLQASSDNPVAGYGDARLRPPEEILGLASDAINILSPQGGGENLGRGLGRSVDYKSQLIPIGATKSRSGVSEPLMYAVNYTDDNGYALISAHRNAPDVLAVTERGNFDAQETSQIEGLQLWLDDMMQYLEEAASVESPYDALSSETLVKTVVDTIWMKNVAPRVKVLWGQRDDKTYPGACEGAYAPNGIAGCSPVAIGMVMSYLEMPAQLNLTWRKDGSKIQLKWNELKKYLSTDDNPPKINPEPSEQNKNYNIRGNISQLLREIGHRENADYHSEGTAVSSSKTFEVVRNLSLTSSNGWEKGAGLQVYEMMFYNSDGILIMRGEDPNMTAGHQWICDGVQSFSVHRSVYESEDDGKNWDLIIEHSESESCMIHQNWGWHGNGNGYYLYNVTTPYVADSIDFTNSREILRILR